MIALSTALKVKILLQSISNQLVNLTSMRDDNSRILKSLDGQVVVDGIQPVALSLTTRARLSWAVTLVVVAFFM